MKKKLNISLIAFAFVMLGFGGNSLAEGNAEITFESPSDGQTFEPGDEVEVRISVNTSSSVQRVYVWPGVQDQNAFSVLESLPYITSFTIPESLTGPVDIYITVQAQDGELIGEKTQTINVVPSDTPNKIRAELSEPIISLEDGPATNNIVVTGIYGDTERDLSLPTFGATYSSSDPSVVTVDPTGVVQLTGPGTAYIVVEVLGLKTYVEVTIPEQENQELTPMDITDQVVMSSSGFRRDPQTGFYVQEISIQNAGQLPLSYPLKLVLDNLPEGVDVENKKGTTSAVMPLRSPIVRVLPVDPDNSLGQYLAPGEWAKAIIEFSNLDGRPISYGKRLFSGASP